MNHHWTAFRIIVTTSILSLGWGTGSGSDALFQVPLELLSQSVCDTILNLPTTYYIPDFMICAGDVENGGKGTCHVSYYYVCQIPMIILIWTLSDQSPVVIFTKIAVNYVAFVVHYMSNTFHFKIINAESICTHSCSIISGWWGSTTDVPTTWAGQLEGVWNLFMAYWAMWGYCYPCWCLH